jgi:hypothetical protein
MHVTRQNNAPVMCVAYPALLSFCATPVMLTGIPAKPLTGSSGLYVSGSAFTEFTWTGSRPDCRAVRLGLQIWKAGDPRTHQSHTNGSVGKIEQRERKRHPGRTFAAAQARMRARRTVMTLQQHSLVRKSVEVRRDDLLRLLRRGVLPEIRVPVIVRQDHYNVRFGSRRCRRCGAATEQPRSGRNNYAWLHDDRRRCSEASSAKIGNAHFLHPSAT